jgi:hypothetical protein
MWSSYSNYKWIRFPKKKGLNCNTNKDAFSSSGYFLSEPKTERVDEENVTIDGMNIAHSSIQGVRPSMEDKHIIKKMHISNHTLVAILDGHAGVECASFVESKFLEVLEQNKKYKEYVIAINKQDVVAVNTLSSALVETYMEIDVLFKEFAEKTIKNYVSSVFAKLGMERRSHAAAFIARLGIGEAGQH